MSCAEEVDAVTPKMLRKEVRIVTTTANRPNSMCQLCQSIWLAIRIPNGTPARRRLRPERIAILEYV